MKARLGFGVLFLVLLIAAVAQGEGRLLQGVILDEAGKPMAGAELFLYDSPRIKRPADFISAKTASDGRYSLQLPAATYWAVARVRHGEKYGPLMPGDLHSGDPQELDLSESDQQADFTVADIRATARAREKTRSDLARVAGRITDQEGKPVAGASVSAWREPVTARLPDVVSGWSDADGGYLLFLPAGTYTMTPAATFPPPPPGAELHRVVIHEGEKAMALDLQLTAEESVPAAGSAAGSPGDGLSISDE